MHAQGQGDMASRISLRKGISLVRGLQVTQSMVVLCCVGFPFWRETESPREINRSLCRALRSEVSLDVSKRRWRWKAKGVVRKRVSSCCLTVAVRGSKGTDFSRCSLVFPPWYYHRGILMSKARRDVEVGQRSCWMTVLSLFFFGAAAPFRI